jgi:hypothetical protein
VGDVREGLEPEAGQSRLDRSEAEDITGMRSGEAEPQAAADILAEDMDWADA